MSQKFNKEVPKVSVDTAKTYLNGMVEDEWRGNGDLPHAVRRVARKIGVSHHQIDHIRRGRAKTCDVTLFEKIRLAYLDHCQKQIEAFRLKQQEASHDPAMILTRIYLIRLIAFFQKFAKRKRGLLTMRNLIILLILLVLIVAAFLTDMGWLV